MYKTKFVTDTIQLNKRATSTKEVAYNLLPVELPQTKLTVCFTSEELKNGHRIPLYFLPTDHHKHFTQDGIKAPYIYTNFEKIAGGVNIEIDLKDHPSVTRAYLTYLIRNHISAFAEITRPNFLRDTQFWFPDPSQEGTKYIVYRKFTVRVQMYQQSTQPELLISYDGQTKVLRKSCQEFERDHSLNDWNRVVYNKRVYPYCKLPEDAKYHPGKVYPVVNLPIALRTGIPIQNAPDKAVHQKYQRQIEDFYQKYIDTDSFKELIPHQGKFKSIPSADQFKLTLQDNLLTFGQNETGKDIIRGLKEWGPAKLPPANRYEYFYIYAEQDKEFVRKIHKLIKSDSDSNNGLKKFLRTPYSMNKAMNIAFGPYKDPLQYLTDRIRQLELNPGKGYFAIFVSPWSEWEQDQKRWIVYFRLKEALLRRNIMLQVFDRNKLVNGNIHLFMPNVAAALTAKLGGVPWRLNKTGQDELIIGFGAFRSKKLKIRYVGASFCFTGDGTFRKFDCFRADSTYAIAGSVVEAVIRYREEKKDIRRVVIHFYKKLSKKEMKPIEDALKGMALNMPVIIVTVNKSSSKDIIAIMQDDTCGMPIAGSYFRFATDRYLLYVNDRFTTEDQNPPNMPLPIKISLSSNNGQLHAEPTVVAEMMQQVYDFCFLHWRSVRRSKLPVTVTYPEMLAKIYPWFADEVLPESTQDKLWML